MKRSIIVNGREYFVGAVALNFGEVETYIKRMENKGWSIIITQEENRKWVVWFRSKKEIPLKKETAGSA